MLRQRIAGRGQRRQESQLRPLLGHLPTQPWKNVNPMDHTLSKGLRLLEHLAASPSPRTVPSLAEQMQLPVSRIHRAVQTLIAAGYVRAVVDGRHYVCTTRLGEQARTITQNLDVRHVALDHMRQLASLTDETVVLCALDGADVVHLDSVESPRAVPAADLVEVTRLPAHCIAPGKALLSQLPDENLDIILGGELEPFTEHTLTDPVALHRELTVIRRRGWAVNRGEWDAARTGVATVVLDAGGRARAALGVSGHPDRVLPAQHRLGAVVLRTASVISRELGHPGRPSRQLVPTRVVTAGVRAPEVSGRTGRKAAATPRSGASERAATARVCAPALRRTDLMTGTSTAAPRVSATGPTHGHSVDAMPQGTTRARRTPPPPVRTKDVGGKVLYDAIVRLLSTVLQELSFPAARWQIVASAELWGADTHTLELLRAARSTQYAELPALAVELMAAPESLRMSRGAAL